MSDYLIYAFDNISKIHICFLKPQYVAGNKSRPYNKNKLKYKIRENQQCTPDLNSLKTTNDNLQLINNLLQIWVFQIVFENK